MPKRQLRQKMPVKNIEKSIQKVFDKKTTRQKVIWNTIFSFIENGIKIKKEFNKEGKIK